MRYRADFTVVGDLVLRGDAPTIELADGREPVQITLRNDPPRSGGDEISLTANVVGVAEALDQVRSAFEAQLANRLDALSFVTRSRFRIERIVRVLEWDPGMKRRKLMTYLHFDPRHPPLSELDHAIAQTTSYLATRSLPDFALHALHHYRLGLHAERTEDQLQFFWFAVERVAVGIADNKRTTVTCRNHSTVSVICPECGETVTRYPTAASAIRALLREIMPSELRPDQTYDEVSTARNKLLHGSTGASVEKATGLPLGIIVDRCAQIAWHAILKTIPVEANRPDLTFATNGTSVVNSTWHAVPVLEFECREGSEYPEDHEIPAPVIKVSPLPADRPSM